MQAATGEIGKLRARRRTAKEHGPDPIDVHVGRQLRLARELSGLTQVEIGKQLQMSFQSVQKYEQGDIRVSASRLFQLAMLLDKPVAYFFKGLENDKPAQRDDDALGRREIELLRAFRLIAHADVQQHLLQLVRSIGNPDTQDESIMVPALPPGDAPGATAPSSDLPYPQE